ncbi:hypothetical protein L1987_84783 [Smallanthus sonchifolius]|uniref:Uncharacterized protein n=1 Tax=Smallanthus sonchifolius TaxID=185202 RepID=A0ACB8XU62_9ASTR|nr:hypothetical protein L1987_84783 [Smallanthus sonchifolius]
MCFTVNESEFPAVDIFVTTADPILEPCIITMNTVLSLLAVDYPAGKLALYLSDDGCSALTFYSLVEMTKFAKLWVPFCKKYNVQVRAPFRYFNSKSTPMEDDSTNMGNFARRSMLQLRGRSHVMVIQILLFSVVSNARTIHLLLRVSGVMTNAPLMLNVDCDMYANNPQVFLHAMCMVFGFKKEENYAFFQFPQAFYDGLKDDPFGSRFADAFVRIFAQLLFLAFYNMSNEDLHKMFGNSIELRESAAQILSESNSKIENRRSPSNFIEVGLLYGSTTEDVLTGLGIHGRGWRSAMTSTDPLAFLGCATTTYQSALTQQKRWVAGLFEVLFTDKNPLLLTVKGNLWFRQALGYFHLCLWAVHSCLDIAMLLGILERVVWEWEIWDSIVHDLEIRSFGFVVCAGMQIYFDVSKHSASFEKYVT